MFAQQSTPQRTPRDAGRSADEEFADAIVAGLTQPQKSLPCRYFYDARGSRLFERITRLPEYYPTRAEVEILSTYGSRIASDTDGPKVLVEFGSGSSRKTEILLAALPSITTYVPIDVSADALEDACKRLQRRFPSIEIVPFHGDFSSSFALPGALAHRSKLGFFPGSTIGNLDPPAALTLLSRFRKALAPEPRLVIGVDLIKDETTLVHAYDDRSGITAAFNLNLLARINRTFGHAFDLDAFSHRAIYDRRRARVEMHLVSREAQTIHLLGRRFELASGETIHTENSHKYSIAGFANLARKAGWKTNACWTDANGLFSVRELKGAP